MPRSLLFVPCEKVMTDDQGNISLITVLTAIRISLNLAEIPDKIAIPMRWDIVTAWWRDPSDTTTSFQQHIELVAPDGTVLIENNAAINVSAADIQRHVARIQGFPVPKLPGRCLLNLHLSAQDGAGWGEPIATYPLTVVVNIQRPKEEE